MPFALVGLVDTTEVNAFGKTVRRFFGADAEPGTNLVRLGVDQAILWTPTITLADAKATVLADSPDDTISAGRRSVLNALAGDRTFQIADRLKDIIFNLLRTPPAGKWNPLDPTSAGRYELLLGPGGVGKNLIASELTAPDGPHSQDINDDFGRSGNVGGSTSSDGQFTWSLIVGTATNEPIQAFRVVSQNIAGLGNGLYLASKAMDTASHYVQAELTSVAGGTSSGHRQDLALWFRANDPLYTHVYDFTVRNGENPGRRFSDTANSVLIASDTTATGSGTVKVQMSGSTYTCEIDGTTIFTGTDTTHTGAAGERNVLFNCYRNANFDSVVMDNFRAADFVGGSSAQPPRTMHQARLRR